MRFIGYATAGVALALALVWAAGPSAEARVRRAAEEAGKAKSFRAVRKTATATEAIVTVLGDTFRWEEPDKRVLIVDMKARTVFVLDLVAKTATRGKLAPGDEGELADMLADTRDVLGTYRRMKADVKHLRDENLGDRDTQVYAITLTVKTPDGANLTVKRTAWLDAKTGLPVRFTCHEPTGDQVAEFSPWNEEFPAALFAHEVPPGFREVKE